MKTLPHISTDNHRNFIQPQRQGEASVNNVPALESMKSILGISDVSSQSGLRLRTSYCFNSRSDADTNVADWCNIQWRQYFDILRYSQYQRNLHYQLVVNQSQVVPISGALW